MAFDDARREESDVAFGLAFALSDLVEGCRPPLDKVARPVRALAMAMSRLARMHASIIWRKTVCNSFASFAGGLRLLDAYSRALLVQRGDD
jgi:hypothetical protein